VTILQQVRATIEQRGLLQPGVRVLVGCSGGPDSAALLLALTRLAPKLGLVIEAASVNHGLRADAEQDIAVAARQAASLGVPFHGLHVQVERGSSLQARARTARYAALLSLACERGATRVAVGHTRDDQAETVLLRMQRGAGLRGLGAIAPHRADGVIRPLLDCERAAVHCFARENFREIVFDPSNLDLRFERVRTRVSVLPALAARAPTVAQDLSRLADEARRAQATLEHAADEVLRGTCIDQETLRISALAACSDALVGCVLQRFLEPRMGRPLGRAHIAQLLRAVRLVRGEVWLPRGLGVRVMPTGLLVLGQRQPRDQLRANETAA
jgi:tRNA(Ile)-lysidine synthase